MNNRAVDLPVGTGTVHVIEDASVGTERGTIVLAPPFGATAAAMFAMAYVFARNGFRVLRIDARSHVGLGSGEIEDFRLSTHVEDLTAVLEEYRPDVTVAVSLSTRSTLRALASGAPTGAAVFVTPVVDVRSTVAAIGTDWFDPSNWVGPDGERLQAAEILGQWVRGGFINDVLDGGFAQLDGSVEDLSRVVLPVVAIAGDSDPWVSVDAVRYVAECANRRGRRVQVLTIRAASHKLHHNPAMTKRYMDAAAEQSLRLIGSEAPVAQVPFAEIIEALGQSDPRAARRLAFGLKRSERIEQRTRQSAPPAPPAADVTETRAGPAAAECWELPLIINGRPVWSGGGPAHRLQYESGIEIRIPVLQPEHIDEIEAAAADIAAAVARLTTVDVTRFLAEVAQQWLRGTPELETALARTAALTGYAPGMVKSDYLIIAYFLAKRANSIDLIAADLGDERIIDEWIPNQNNFIRCFPRGLVLHYLVGNLPLAGLGSLVRAVLTKNRSLAKLATREPVAPLAFLEAMRQVDPDHPITRSISAAYWPHSSEVEDRCLALADAACVWGGKDALKAIKQRIPPGVPVSEYGPKWSAAVIDLRQADPFEAAFRLVADVAYYDQEACLSAQRAFVLGPIDPFRQELRRAFESFAERMPMQKVARDALAHRSLTLLEAECLGIDNERVGDAAILTLRQGDEPPPHPLARTIYLQQLDDIGELERYLDKDSQTLGVFPWTLSLAHRDEWVNAGVDRITELGMARHPRPGFTHDGLRGLIDLVRTACVERPISTDPSKYQQHSHDQMLSYLFVIPQRDATSHN